MTGASDCRFMSQVSDNCLRFTPFAIDDKQLESIHGIDENVDVATLAPAVDFYKYILLEQE
jgi:carboxypeptidase PM20D1